VESPGALVLAGDLSTRRAGDGRVRRRIFYQRFGHVAPEAKVCRERRQEGRRSARWSWRVTDDPDVGPATTGRVLGAGPTAISARGSSGAELLGRGGSSANVYCGPERYIPPPRSGLLEGEGRGLSFPSATHGRLRTSAGPPHAVAGHAPHRGGRRSCAVPCSTTETHYPEQYELWVGTQTRPRRGSGAQPHRGPAWFRQRRPKGTSGRGPPGKIGTTFRFCRCVQGARPPAGGHPGRPGAKLGPGRGRRALTRRKAWGRAESYYKAQLESIPKRRARRAPEPGQALLEGRAQSTYNGGGARPRPARRDPGQSTMDKHGRH